MNEVELKRLIKASELYYNKNLTQAEIARELSVSRPTVSNLLAKARREGIVKIEIVNYENTQVGLGQTLRDRFNLKSCTVVSDEANKNRLQKRVYETTIGKIVEFMPKIRVFGIGWGYNISMLIDMFDNLPEGSEKKNGVVCPMIGTATIPHKGYHPNEMAVELAEKIGFDSSFLISPSFPASEQEADLFKTTENYSSILTYWKRLDTALVTLGSYPCVPDHATASRFGRKLVVEQASSNLLSYFFNADGRQICGEDDYAIQIPIKYLSRIRNLIGMVPVESSPQSILGSLNTGFIKHLIIDEQSAKRIYNMIN